MYFYSFTDPSVAASANTDRACGTATGTVGRLKPGEAYIFRWFDPVSGECSEEGAFCASDGGLWKIGERPKAADMVLLIRKAEREKESGELR